MKINEIIAECTSAGSIAAVNAPLGQTLFRNPSIYDEPGSYVDPNKKKKKKAKYKTTKNKD